MIELKSSPSNQTNFNDQIKSLNGLIKNFEYLSTLREGSNIQQASWGTSLLRSQMGWEEIAVEITFDLGIGLYAKVTDAYSKENFDYVIKHYSSEVYKANEVFENTISIIKNFDTDCSIESKIHLLQTAKSAFWHLAAARIGFHEWTKTLSSKFKDQSDALEYRIIKINSMIVQENRILNKIFKQCLCEFPKAIEALSGNLEMVSMPKETCIISNKFDRAAFITMAEHMSAATRNLINIVYGYESSFEEVKLIKQIEKNKAYLFRAASEFVNVTKNFTINLEKYENELKLLSEVFEGKLQVKAYQSLLSRGAVIRTLLSDIPDGGIDNIDDAKEVIDLLHCLFVSKEGMNAPEGVSFIAELISATIDINMETRSRIEQVINQEEKELFPHSCTSLWQVLAYQMVTSRFTMPVSEMLEHAKNIPAMGEYVEKLKDLLDLFRLAADLANKSIK